MPEFTVTAQYLLGEKVNFRNYEAVITSIRIFKNKKIKHSYGITYHLKTSDDPTMIVDVPEKELSKKPIKKTQGDSWYAGKET